MLQITYQIARNTFRECIRQPIYGILTLTSLFFIVIAPLFALFVFREQQKLVRDATLATTMLFGWITAVLCASHAINREIETGTILLVLAKPVNRGHFLAAKTLGIMGALALFVFTCSCASMMALRVARDDFRLQFHIFAANWIAIAIAASYGAWVNFSRKRSFTDALGKCLALLFGVMAVIVYFVPKYTDGGSYTGEFAGYDWNTLRALGLILLAVLAMGALATALSTSLGLVANLSVCLTIFLLGLVSDYVYLKITSMTETDLAFAMHYWFLPFVPLWIVFWIVTASQFSQRQAQKSNPALLMHLSYGLVLLALVWRGVMNFTRQVDLMEPTPVMQAVARGLYPVLTWLAEFLHNLIPNWQLFWMADALTDEKLIPAEYLGTSVLYLTYFCYAFLVIGMLLFARREVGRQMRQ